MPDKLSIMARLSGNFLFLFSLFFYSSLTYIFFFGAKSKIECRKIFRKSDDLV